jgi:chromosome segregation ATPase
MSDYICVSDWDIERIQVENTQDIANQRAKMIENLQEELKQAGELCKTLRADKEQLEEKCSQLLDKQYQDDYKVENAKKIVENLKKTVERYESENKAMRELLRQWI